MCARLSKLEGDSVRAITLHVGARLAAIAEPSQVLAAMPGSHRPPSVGWHFEVHAACFGFSPAAIRAR